MDWNRCVSLNHWKIIHIVATFFWDDENFAKSAKNLFWKSNVEFWSTTTPNYFFSTNDKFCGGCFKESGQRPLWLPKNFCCCLSQPIITKVMTTLTCTILHRGGAAQALQNYKLVDLISLNCTSKQNGDLMVIEIILVQREILHGGQPLKFREKHSRTAKRYCRQLWAWKVLQQTFVE